MNRKPTIVRKTKLLLHLLGSLLLNLLLCAPLVAPAAQVTAATDPTCSLRYLNGRPDSASDPTQLSGRNEYDVKAALLFRCLELVQWPATESASPAAPASSSLSTSRPAPLVIGLLGKDSFGNSLDSFGRKVLSGRPLIVKKLSTDKQALECNLVFVAASEKKRTDKILKKLQGLPILTVGETPGFNDAGGMINFMVEGKKVRLQLNTAAAAKVGLTLDPQLVKLAPPAASSGSRTGDQKS